MIRLLGVRAPPIPVAGDSLVVLLGASLLGAPASVS